MRPTHRGDGNRPAGSRVAGESVFREAAVERLSTPDRLDQGLSIVGRATWIILLALGTLVIGGLAWSAILTVPVTVRGQGMLLAPGGVLDVTSESPGRVISFTINIGDHVNAGTIVARLDQPEVRQELANAESEHADAQEERRQITEHQQRRTPVLSASIVQRRKAFEEQIVFLDQRLVWLAEKAKADEELSTRNLTTRQKVLETKLEIGRAQEERAQAQNGTRNLDVEASKAQIDDQRELLNVNLKIAAAERKIRTLRDKLERQSTVTSPYDGIVVWSTLGRLSTATVPCSPSSPAKGRRRKPMARRPVLSMASSTFRRATARKFVPECTCASRPRRCGGRSSASSKGESARWRKCPRRSKG